MCRMVWGESACHISGAQTLPQGQSPGSEAGPTLTVMTPQQKRLLCPLRTRVWYSAWTHMALEKLCFLKSCLTLTEWKHRVCCIRACAKFSSSESSMLYVPGPVICCTVGGLAGQTLLRPRIQRWAEICGGWMRIWSWL